jgi:hypothetical protein
VTATEGDSGGSHAVMDPLVMAYLRQVPVDVLRELEADPLTGEIGRMMDEYLSAAQGFVSSAMIPPPLSGPPPPPPPASGAVVVPPGAVVVSVGPVESSVRRDLDRLGKLDEGVRGSLAQMALRMARAYDQYAGADLTKLSRANQELRATLQAMTEVGDDGDDDPSARLPSPVRNGAESGAVDAGRAGGGGSGPVG